MGRRDTLDTSNSPSVAGVSQLEALAVNPFTKNADFARAVLTCLDGLPASHAENDELIGRVGYAIVSRLLEIFAGAAPRSADETSSPGALVVAAAQQFYEHAATDASACDDEIPHLVNRLMSLAPVRDCFRSAYRLPDELELDHIRLHRTGTTSAIFRCRWSGGADVALKVTLARYFSVDALSKASETYGARFPTPTRIAPQIYCSEARFIVLGFVEGTTLEEGLMAIAAGNRDERSGARRVNEAFEVMLALLKALDALATSEGSLEARHHLDLTPNNVIVPAGSEVADLKLIDFGRNQLLVEPIAASSSAIAKAAQYVSREIREGTIEESDASFAAADAYSAGLLALETFAPGDSQSMNNKLDELWQLSPGLAMILEDVLVEDSSGRLQLLPQEERQNPFPHLIERLEREKEVELEFATELAPSGRAGTALRLVGRPRQILRMYKISTKFAKDVSDYRRYRGLALWNAVAMLAWMSIWVTVLGLVMYHVGKTLHLGWIEARGNELGEQLFQSFKTEKFPKDLWGREIAFSFGLMAFTYYTNIYATVWFPVTGGRRLERRARLANAMARSLAFVTPAPCIVGALVAPQIWPWATIFGVCWAAASNWAMAKLHLDVWETTKEAVGPDTDPTGHARHVFNEWALQMTIYAGGVTIIALALHFLKRSGAFPVDDVGAYVTVLTFLNLFFIVRLNCIQQAPLMRGFLQRTAFHLRRLDATSSVEPSAAHESARESASVAESSA